MTMIEAVQSVLSKYADFSGRARRSEYWYFFLANCLVFLVLWILALIPKVGLLFGILYLLLALALIVPGLATSVRRLHDSGKSGWLLLLNLVPFVGGLVVLWFLVMDSDLGHNEFGPSPKPLP